MRVKVSCSPTVVVARAVSCHDGQRWDIERRRAYLLVVDATMVNSTAYIQYTVDTATAEFQRTTRWIARFSYFFHWKCMPLFSAIHWIHNLHRFSEKSNRNFNLLSTKYLRQCGQCRCVRTSIEWISIIELNLSANRDEVQLYMHWILATNPWNCWSPGVD